MTPKKDTPEFMASALRTLADIITSPDDIPAMCLRDAANMIEALETTADAAQKRVTELEEALRPFAEAGKFCTDDEPDDEAFYSLIDDERDEIGAILYYGDLRRAAAMLGKDKEAV